ncbi:MAG: sulfite exporter TauE/SafE family protein [Candidatus Dojkabacteria bacterium]|nr:sulfite exporter TauE/SafE family protein [Candidatus Dojkabacteria bacterium]
MKKKINWSEFIYAGPIALIIIILFVLLQKTGVVDFVNVDSVNLPAVFLIGLVASISSCAAVVGGLALSISSSFSMAGKKVGTVSSISFHLGRLLGFFVLGGIIGWLGSLFTLEGDSSRYWSIGTSLFTGVILLTLALGLIFSSDFFKKFTPKLPKSVSNKLLKVQDVNVDSSSAKTPILAMIIPALAGVITFFLPCGFTQSMQMFSLGTGSFINGALTMFVFSLGTLPVLAMLSFASIKLSEESKYSGIFFKTAGLLVLFFAILNLSGALTVMGIIDPLFTF